MAMPVSGSIGLRDCISGIACSSISCAVASTACNPASLSSLSVQAGSPYSTAPYCMREFYGYTPIVNTPICLCQYAAVGTNGISSYLTRAYCVTPLPSIGTTYTICLYGFMSTVQEQTGSYAFICVTCNFGCKMCCCISNNNCQTPNVSFLVDENDCVRIYTCVCSTNTSCILWACVNTCLSAVSGTGYCKSPTASLTCFPMYTG